MRRFHRDWTIVTPFVESRENRVRLGILRMFPAETTKGLARETNPSVPCAPNLAQMASP